jgi:pantoate--beta-alanine ligase
MQVYRTIAEVRRARAQLTESLGLVPTMGYLHEGHLSLVRASQRDNPHTAAWIFVNPTQFNDPKDLAAYPRDEAHDLAMLEEHGVDFVFMPTPEEIYPPDFQTYITVERLTQGLEGEHRPGHFRGVATVVTKFFNILQPQRAYFGQKDAQQCAVIKQLVRDLNLSIEIVVCPTLRESDGLAMSSRNARLSPEERQAATILFAALSAARDRYQSGERHPDTLRRIMTDTIQTQPLARIDYVSAADADSLAELTAPSDHPILLSLAVFIGAVRLIDNLILSPDL